MIAGAGVLGVLVLHEVTRTWAPAARLALLAMSGSLLVPGVGLIEPPEPTFGSKTLGRFRRLGELLPTRDPAVPDSWVSVSPVSSALTSRGMDRVRFAIRRRNSLIAFGIAVPVAAASILLALDGLVDDELTEGALIAAVVAGPAIFVAIRSLIRLLLAHRAITFTADRMKLGVALGYLPPLAIERHQLTQVRQVPSIGLVIDHKVVYPLTGNHLVDPDGLVGWIVMNWPEVPIVPVRYELEVERPVFIDGVPTENSDTQTLPDKHDSREAALEAAQHYVEKQADALHPDSFVWITAVDGFESESVGGVFPDGTEGD